MLSARLLHYFISFQLHYLCYYRREVFVLFINSNDFIRSRWIELLKLFWLTNLFNKHLKSIFKVNLWWFGCRVNSPDPPGTQHGVAPRLWCHFSGPRNRLSCKCKSLYAYFFLLPVESSTCLFLSTTKK